MTENTVLDNNVSSIIKKEAIPNLRFSEFTRIWEKKQLKNFMQFKNGLNADKDKFGSGVKFISVMDILNNPYITYELIKGKVNIDSNILKAYSVTYGDVLFQRSSETRIDAGKSNVYLDKNNVATFGGFVIRGRKNGNYNPEFMNSLLKTNFVRREISSKAQGAQHFNVGQETLENVVIFIPELTEQEKIASFLTSIDNIISTQESNISILETYNRGLLNDIFTRKIKFKNEDGEKYPDWEEKPLSEEFPFIRNGFVGTVTDHFSDKEHGIRYIEGTNIHNGRIDDNVEVYVTEEFHQKHKKNELKADDIVMVQSGHVGDCAVVGSKYAGSNCHALIIMSNGGKVDSYYVAKYFLSDVGKKDLEILKTGNTVKHILSSDMNKFRLPFPCLEEQQKIADCLSAIDKVVEQEKVYLEQLKTIKKGLLQQMFV